jgi:hypothetical protein
VSSGLSSAPLRPAGPRLLRFGLLLVGGTFVVVAATLALQMVNAIIRPIGGLHYLLAACDPPAVSGAWLAAVGARRTRAQGPLLVAAISLSAVAVVVLGDLVLGRIAAGSAAAVAISSKPAWLVADAATIISLGALAFGARRVWARLPRALAAAIALLLLVRAVAAVVGATGTIPWLLRAPEPVLFLLVSYAAIRASRVPSSEDRAA